MTKGYLFIATVLLITACSGNNDRSDAYGNFEVKDIIISSQAQGEIKSFNLEEGQILKPGEVIGVIDTVQLYLKKQQLMAQKQSTLTRLSGINAQINVQDEQEKTLVIEKNRIEKLLKDNAVAPRQYDDIKGKLNVNESTIKSIKTQTSTILADLDGLGRQIAQIDDQLVKCYIVNPIQGTVLEKYAEPFEITSPGKALYKIADLSEMKLKVYISGSQLPKVKIGQKVEVLIDKDKRNDSKLEGTVCWISEEAEFTPKIIQTKEERVNMVYAIKILVKNDGQLKIGMPGEVNFTLH
jgi:HlyD family secretion protein